MEIYVTASREQQLLFRQIVDDAARRASAMLALPHEAARLRAVSHQGLTPIDQLELSPLAEDQLLAAALRLYPGAARPRAMVAALRRHFTTPPGWLAVEAQRRAAWGDVAGRGLPIERAAQCAADIERRLKGVRAEVSVKLRAYADLYADLWCDPRIAAPASVRREMLALVSALQARCVALADEERAP